MPRNKESLADLQITLKPEGQIADDLSLTHLAIERLGLKIRDGAINTSDEEVYVHGICKSSETDKILEAIGRVKGRTVMSFSATPVRSCLQNSTQ